MPESCGLWRSAGPDQALYPRTGSTALFPRDADPDLRLRGAVSSSPWGSHHCSGVWCKQLEPTVSTKGQGQEPVPRGLCHCCLGGGQGLPGHRGTSGQGRADSSLVAAQSSGRSQGRAAQNSSAAPEAAPARHPSHRGSMPVQDRCSVGSWTWSAGWGLTGHSSLRPPLRVGHSPCGARAEGTESAKMQQSSQCPLGALRPRVGAASQVAGTRRSCLDTDSAQKACDSQIRILIRGKGS